MRAFQRIAAVLIFPALAWLGAACDRPDPTAPQAPGVSMGLAARIPSG